MTFQKDNMVKQGVSISSSVEEKIEWASECYRKLGRKILGDQTVVDLLDQLQVVIPASHAEMLKAGIVNLCMECELDEGGSCCGSGLEDKYDGLLLLINLLLGVELPNSRSDPKSCFFLGQNGCLLQARHVICINYICRKISEQIKPRDIISLREKEGVEIKLVFSLHERVRSLLKKEK